MEKKIQINSQRLKSFWEEVNRFGLNAETGGINRIGYTEADTNARKWFAEKMKDAGFTVRYDKIMAMII